MAKASIIIIIAGAAAAAAWGGTDVRQADITKDTTWGLSGSPYYIYGDITVRNGATLTIKAGVEVRFVEIHGDGGYEDGAEMVVRRGALVAVGTDGMPVVFTSANASKKKGDWGALIVEYGNQYILENAIIEYAKNGLRLFETTANGASSSSVAGTVIRYCLNNGVLAYRSHGDFYHLTVTANDYAGIRTLGPSNVCVRLCDLYDNGVYNFSNGSSANVDATDCWWGTTVPGLIELRIYDRHDNPAMGEVDYTPFLSGSWRDGGNVPTYSLGLVRSVFR